MIHENAKRGFWICRYDLLLSDRIYKCICGNIIDRDINGALNIAIEGFRIQYDVSTQDIEEKYSVVGPTVVTCM